jgi:hypothetical protein
MDNTKEDSIKLVIIGISGIVAGILALFVIAFLIVHFSLSVSMQQRQLRRDQEAELICKPETGKLDRRCMSYYSQWAD